MKEQLMALAMETSGIGLTMMFASSGVKIARSVPVLKYLATNEDPEKDGQIVAYTDAVYAGGLGLIGVSIVAAALAGVVGLIESR